MQTPNSPAGTANTVRQKDRFHRDSLERFLPDDECLIWTGGPQLSRLFLRAISLSALMALIASVGVYFALQGISTSDICGPEPSRACTKLYVWPWFGLVVAAIYTPLLWLGFFAHAGGLLREMYGLSERRVLRLRSNPFDRFQSVKFGQLAEERIAVRKQFGTIKFGSVAFLCLSDPDAEAAQHAAFNRAALGG